MKKHFIPSVLLILSLFIAQNANAQSAMQDFFDQTRIEIGAGWHTIAPPTNNIKGSEFSSFNSFYGGLHYALNEVWGLRGTYAYHNFEHKDLSQRNLTQHKLMLEITYSLGSALTGDYRYTDFNNFDVLAHAGFGASLMKREVNSGNDYLSNIQLGIMPSYKIGDRIALHADFSYVINGSQNYTFSGIYNTGTVEAFFNANLGISVALGR